MMPTRTAASFQATLLGAVLAALLYGSCPAAEPPALNPFARNPAMAGEREDAIPGYVEMSDGSIHYGRLYLTRDKRIQIYDATIERQREIPLDKVAQLECKVMKEWIEKDWRFKELALDEKLYSGKSYPAREYKYALTLQDGRTIEGSTSGIVYLIPGDYGPTKPGEYRPEGDPERYFLHKRDKGKVGEQLKDLKYVKSIKLGEEAFQAGKKKALSHRNSGTSSSYGSPGTKPARKTSSK
jgi:hypothetical protein